MRVRAECQSVIESGNLVKVFMVWRRSPNLPEEYLWINMLRDRKDFGMGKCYRITIEEEGPPPC